MPKWRKISTDLPNSLDFEAIDDDFIRLMWIMMILVADREGRGLAHLMWLKSKMFPLREDVTTEHIHEGLYKLRDLGLITVYIDDDRAYFQICSWGKYQTNTRKEAPSQYPAPPNSGVTPDLVPTYSGPSPALDIDIDIDIDSESKALRERELEKIREIKDPFDMWIQMVAVYTGKPVVHADMDFIKELVTISAEHNAIIAEDALGRAVQWRIDNKKGLDYNGQLSRGVRYNTYKLTGHQDKSEIDEIEKMLAEFEGSE
jgi:hypothetical protein